MFKNFLLKRMLEKQLGALPQGERDKIIQAFLENPSLFESIAKKAQEKIDSGKSQSEAVQEAALEHQQELQAILNINQK